jgi:transposase
MVAEPMELTDDLRNKLSPHLPEPQPRRADRLGRSRARTQDGRAFRRYRCRWKMERFFSWLGYRRRVVVRWDRHWENTLGWVQLATILILASR